ncbi:ARD/ARD' family-domain-containing protein [Mycena crocata]|nr:ARD/ARD' family-domain-containing protein [Mycena crocata]
MVAERKKGTFGEGLEPLRGDEPAGLAAGGCGSGGKPNMMTNLWTWKPNNYKLPNISLASRQAHHNIQRLLRVPNSHHRISSDRPEGRYAYKNYFNNIQGEQRPPRNNVPPRPVPPGTLAALKSDTRTTIDVSKDGMGEGQRDFSKNEEIRYILRGSAFFYASDTSTNECIRIAVTPGGLLVIPAGIYHRCTLDEADIRVLRLFQDEPKWVPYNRGADTEMNPHRIDYSRSVGVGS